jgi:hypothetical protein
MGYISKLALLASLVKASEKFTSISRFEESILYAKMTKTIPGAYYFDVDLTRSTGSATGAAALTSNRNWAEVGFDG